MVSKHKSSDVVNSDMPKRSHKVLSLKEKGMYVNMYVCMHACTGEKKYIYISSSIIHGFKNLWEDLRLYSLRIMENCCRCS